MYSKTHVDDLMEDAVIWRHYGFLSAKSIFFIHIDWDNIAI